MGKPTEQPDDGASEPLHSEADKPATLLHFLPADQLPQGEKSKQYIAALAVESVLFRFVATLGSFGIGCGIAWTSPTLPYLSSNSTCLDTPLNTEQGAWVGSLLAIGAIIGSIPTGWMADWYGRKLTIIGMSVPSLLSWMLIIFGRTVWMIYIARVLAGISMGGFSVVSPMYVGEIAEISIRGALGSYFEVMLCFGIMVVYIVGALVNYLWLAIIMSLVPFLSIFIFLFMPETPSYLLMRGDRANAEAVLQHFRGVNYNVGPEIAILQKELDVAKSSTTTLKDSLSSGANVNALVISFGLMLAQQLSGVNIVIFYTADIFIQAGSNIHPDYCAAIIGTVQAGVTCLSMLLVDRAGRRLLLLCSATLSLICLIALGVYFYLHEHDPVKATAISWLPLTAVNVFVVAMALGLGPIPWLMLGELFSSSVKGAATSASCLLNSLLIFFVTKTFVNFVEAVGIAGTFWFYAAITACATLFIFFRVPETKGKSFLEIQTMLATT